MIAVFNLKVCRQESKLSLLGADLFNSPTVLAANEFYKKNLRLPLLL
jgi:hypothetical protein